MIEVNQHNFESFKSNEKAVLWFDASWQPAKYDIESYEKEFPDVVFGIYRTDPQEEHRFLRTKFPELQCIPTLNLYVKGELKETVAGMCDISKWLKEYDNMVSAMQP